MFYLLEEHILKHSKYIQELPLFRWPICPAYPSPAPPLYIHNHKFTIISEVRAPRTVHNIEIHRFFNTPCYNLRVEKKLTGLFVKHTLFYADVKVAVQNAAHYTICIFLLTFTVPDCWYLVPVHVAVYRQDPGLHDLALVLNKLLVRFARNLQKPKTNSRKVKQTYVCVLCKTKGQRMDQVMELGNGSVKVILCIQKCKTCIACDNWNLLWIEQSRLVFLKGFIILVVFNNGIQQKHLTQGLACHRRTIFYIIGFDNTQ